MAFITNATPSKENPPVRSWLNTYNRDWHAIIDHAGLAKAYETFIKHDFDWKDYMEMQ